MESLIRKINRYRQSRGYGVQSPSDYEFIRNVIKERMPYYAYAAMKKRFPKLKKKRRKLCELYFRLVNYCQPEMAVIKCGDDGIYAEYLKAASRRIAGTTADICEAEGTRAMIIADSNELTEKAVETISTLKEKSVVVIENIGKTGSKTWNTLQQLPCAGTSYDMKSIGIIVMQQKMYQKHYTINL